LAISSGLWKLLSGVHSQNFFKEEELGMRISKVLAVFVALFLAVFMASSAMAFNVTNRSAEMDDFSPCDRAGTIRMNWTQSDLTQINTWLVTHDYALIRIALNGTDLPTNPTLPKLCKDIHGTATYTGLVSGNPIPNSGQLVLLDELNVEISDITGSAAGPDGVIYVHGNAGDQFISVYIVSTAGVVIGATEDLTSWFKIGLFDELVGAVTGAEKTSICAQVLSFSGVSKLTISNEAFPNTLTFSGDNEIGHFLTQLVTLRNCVKAEKDVSDTTEIALCPLGGTEQSPACPNYVKCFVAEGDFNPNETIKLTLRLNGAANGATTQSGVYFLSVLLYDEAGVAINTVPFGAITAGWKYFKSNGTSTAAMPCAAWEAQIAVAYIDRDSVINAGNELRFVVNYTVNPDQAAANTDVRIWATGETQPCGTVFDGVITAARLTACGSGISNTILFPYFTAIESGAWWNGIVIVNLGTTVGTATVKVYEKDGDVFTSQPITLGPTDRLLARTLNDPFFVWSGSGTFGDTDCYVKVTTDFNVDGFAMMGNNSPGNDDSMGYLPRLDIRN